MRNIFLFFCLLFIGIYMISCHSNSIENTTIQFIDLNQEGILPDKEYVFYPVDTNFKDYLDKTFSLYGLVRYTGNCHIKDLPFTVEYYSFQVDTICEDYIEIPLFDEMGEKKGKGSFGIFTTKFLIHDSLKYNEEFYVSLSSKEKDASGIQAIGILCKFNE